MKYKQLLCSLIILVLTGLQALQAQILYVREQSGTQTTFTLSGMRKMTFSSGNITVQKKDNSAGVYALSGLKHLVFQNNTTVVEEQILIGNANLIAYPNPVADLLNIDLTGSDNMMGSISILSIEGKVLQEHKAKGESSVTLNLSQLPRGIYLCRYTSQTGCKTVKIIKQ